MNELSNHTISDIQIHVRHHVIPKVPVLGFGKNDEIPLKALT